MGSRDVLGEAARVIGNFPNYDRCKAVCQAAGDLGDHAGTSGRYATPCLESPSRADLSPNSGRMGCRPASDVAGNPRPRRAGRGRLPRLRLRHFSEPPSERPTGQKPESKLWYTPDKIWWGVLYNKASGKFEIYQFDRATQSWSTTGTPIDTRKPSASDTLWDGSALHVVSHLKDTSSNTDQRIIYQRFTYDSGSKTYTSATSAITLTNRKVEAAVFDKDSVGRLWLTFTDVQGPGREVYKHAHDERIQHLDLALRTTASGGQQPRPRRHLDARSEPSQQSDRRFYGATRTTPPFTMRRMPTRQMTRPGISQSCARKPSVRMIT